MLIKKRFIKLGRYSEIMKVVSVEQTVNLAILTQRDGIGYPKDLHEICRNVWFGIEIHALLT